MTPGATGYMPKEDETRIGIPGSDQGIDMLFDMTLLNTTSRKMQLQWYSFHIQGKKKGYTLCTLSS